MGNSESSDDDSPAEVANPANILVPMSAESVRLRRALLLLERNAIATWRFLRVWPEMVALFDTIHLHCHVEIEAQGTLLVPDADLTLETVIQEGYSLYTLEPKLMLDIIGMDAHTQVSLIHDVTRGRRSEFAIQLRSMYPSMHACLTLSNVLDRVRRVAGLHKRKFDEMQMGHVIQPIRDNAFRYEHVCEMDPSWEPRRPSVHTQSDRNYVVEGVHVLLNAFKLRHSKAGRPPMMPRSWTGGKGGVWVAAALARDQYDMARYVGIRLPLVTRMVDTMIQEEVAAGRMRFGTGLRRLFELHGSATEMPTVTYLRGWVSTVMLGQGWLSFSVFFGPDGFTRDQIHEMCTDLPPVIIDALHKALTALAECARAYVKFDKPTGSVGSHPLFKTRPRRLPTDRREHNRPSPTRRSNSPVQAVSRQSHRASLSGSAYDEPGADDDDDDDEYTSS